MYRDNENLFDTYDQIKRNYLDEVERDKFT